MNGIVRAYESSDAYTSYNNRTDLDSFLAVKCGEDWLYAEGLFSEVGYACPDSKVSLRSDFLFPSYM